MLNVFSYKTTLNLALEYLETDLEVVIKDRSLLFKPADVKSWMRMMLLGVSFCHQHWFIHRVRFFAIVEESSRG